PHFQPAAGPSLQHFQPAPKPMEPGEQVRPAEERQPIGTKLFVKVGVGKITRVEGADGYIVTLGSHEAGSAAVAGDASPGIRSLGGKRVWLQSGGEHDFPLAVELAKRLEEGGSTVTGVLIPVTRGENDIGRWRFQIPGGVRLGVSIRTPAMAQVAGSFIKDGIVMANIELKSLVQLSMGLQRPDNEMHPAVLGMISRVFDSCREVGAKACVSIEPDYLNIENVESLLRQGADCLCVEPALLGNLKDAVSRAERKLLLERGPVKEDDDEQAETAPLAESFLQESPGPDEYSPEPGQNESGGSEGFFNPSSFSSWP
ncbi:MAG: hypothetical protein JXC85_05605, partial [Candidatus Aenigmarchaeota archaeon]|nr:hypothetical protein [Candidatus Aenigmarchaeota archaeon]